MACVLSAISRNWRWGLPIVGVFAISLGVAASRAQHSSDGDARSLLINHQAHVKGEVDCLACHAGVLDPAEARLPTLDTCTGCHKDPPGDNVEKQKLTALAETGKPPVWTPTFDVADHVYFSHARHIDVAELECTSCHSDMPERTTPLRADKLRTMSMDECINCHKQHLDNPAARRAAFDCAACHR